MALVHAINQPVTETSRMGVGCRSGSVSLPLFRAGRHRPLHRFPDVEVVMPTPHPAEPGDFAEAILLPGTLTGPSTSPTSSSTMPIR